MSVRGENRPMHWLAQYIVAINGIKDMGNATEASYRTPIQTMLQAAAAEFGAAVNILHEPGRAKKFGSPDFLVSAKGGGVVGYVECKRPGADLDEIAGGEQIRKYRVMSENIMLTDSFRWLHLRDGKICGDIRIGGKADADARQKFPDALRVWMEGDIEQVGDPGELAAVLAHRCAMLRDGLREHKNDDETLSAMHGLWRMFQNLLNKDLDFAGFADIFAQTFVYSLLMAKTKAPAGTQLDLFSAPAHIPSNYAVIRELAGVLQKLDHAKYADLKSIIGNILAVINGIDTVALAETMTYKSGATDEDDPYLNFYEPFLAAYDPDLREKRGVYYTPPPVVKFIVRIADKLLRDDLGMQAGFAEDGVTALDFATGTGTFMLEMARAIFDGKNPTQRNMLAHKHFLPNFYGFELMASPYVIAHMKLSQFLEDSGAGLADNERVKIFLTNTLERTAEQAQFPAMASLAEEAKLAQSIKKSPVLVIVGNPPYSAASQNKGKWIGELLRGVDDGKKVGGGYYEVDGETLAAQGEKNTKWLQDDYVKFIRFAQWKMQTEERGIVAVITNHAFLDNPTFRGMRQSLMKTFDALYFLDLHGNSKKKEKPPGGGADENVFDIQQGVAISLLVKSPAAKKKGVFHADMWGSRAEKYAACARQNAGKIKWKKINPAPPKYYFIPRDERGEAEYNAFYSLSEMFSLSSVGIVTSRDDLTIGLDKAAFRRRVEAFAAMPPEEAREHFNLGADVRDWGVERAQQDLRDSGLSADKYCGIAYRPFDVRHTYYTGKSRGFHCMPRGEVMRQMQGDNIALLFKRQNRRTPFSYAFVTDRITESCVFESAYANNSVAPLYRHETEMGESKRRENFTDKFREWINARYGKAHKPEDILGCIYACLHSPDYRERYADFLLRDFPRIPFPEKNGEFKRLAAIGNELIAAHLLRANCGGKYGQLNSDCKPGAAVPYEVEKVRYDGKDGGRLYFNKDVFFAPLPPEVFNFQIGGYKPLDRFLKSRKGRKLSAAEISTMEKAANAIAFTIKKMAEIDA